MEGIEVGGFVALFSWMVGVAADTLGHFTKWFVDLQAQYPQLLSLQTLFGAIGVGLAIWKWYETREAGLFRKFESMIARNEAQLVRARTDLLDVMNRPGPGLIIHAPIFVEKRLRAVLHRRKWYPASLWPIGLALSARAIERSRHISIGCRYSESKLPLPG
jgi:hypothetical protein